MHPGESASSGGAFVVPSSVSGQEIHTGTTLTPNGDTAMPGPITGRATWKNGIAVAAGAMLVALSVLTATPGLGAAGRAAPVTSSYGTDPLQTVTLYAAGARLAVLVHGGGFRSSTVDAAHLAPEAKDLQKAGITAAIVNYRDDASAPAFPNEVDDVVAGARAAMALTGTTQVSVIGGSSGGTLASLAAESLGPQASTVFPLSGTEDLPGALAYWTAVGGKQGALHIGNITTALGGADPALYSPAALVSSALAGQTWYVYNSAAELQPVSQADTMTAALRAQGIPVTETIVPGHGHAWAYWKTIRAQVIATVLA